MGMKSNHQLSPSSAEISKPITTRVDASSAAAQSREKGADCLIVRTAQVFSLRIKLLFFVTMLVLIPGGMYGAISLSNSRAALAQVVGRLLVEEAREVADRLATTLRSERERLESFATQDVMREIRIA